MSDPTPDATSTTPNPPQRLFSEQTLVGGAPHDQTPQPSSAPAPTNGVKPPGPPTSPQKSEAASTSTDEGKGNTPSTLAPKKGPHEIRKYYAYRITGTFLLLIAPWIFYGIVVHKTQLILGRSAAEQVANHPRTTTHAVVTLAGLLSTAVTFLFGASVVCVAQKWIATHKPPPADLIAANSDRRLTGTDKKPLRIGYLGRLAKIKGLQPVLAFNSRRARALTILAFLLYTSCNQATAGIAAMFTPQPVSLTTSLTGSEIDFASTDTECIAWYQAHPPPQTCGYNERNGFTFTTCLGENQLFDVIQAGRDNAALVNSSVPSTFPRLNGTRFLGTFPGVLVAGPNGLNEFSTISPGNSKAFAESPSPGISYNYSLPLQGVSLGVSCDYSNETIVAVSADLPFLNWNTSCPPGTDDFLQLFDDAYQTLASNLTMGVWACKQNATDNKPLSYSIYLRGVNSYLPVIGNMTCVVDVALADYEIEYLGAVEYFTTTEGPNLVNATGSSPDVFVGVFDEVIRRGVDVVINSQTGLTGNLVAETMLALGAEFYGLNQTARDERYPQLLSKIFQGMLNYQVSRLASFRACFTTDFAQAGYLRLLYAGLDTTLPQNCLRDVSGVVTYPGIGWSTLNEQFNPAFLAPHSVVLLLTLVLFIAALFMPEPWDSWDPTDPSEVAVAAHQDKLRFITNPVAEDAKDHYLVRKIDQVARAV
ncbi:hypothetical protein BDN72DRAFT_895469 [Pluteus cervinus]|uniref:Uncharacterized protein n=1 Tax=Pluteus cervinus TaxID=181527 RepID=A0ACD3B3T9_9AGAR|nr:hypothetical protein BDN72DRAFT_895469 [Pluteus cervinus]